MQRNIDGVKGLVRWVGACIVMALMKASLDRAIRGSDSFGNTCGVDNRNTSRGESCLMFPFFHPPLLFECTIAS